MNDVKIQVYDKQIYEEHEDVNEMQFEGQTTFKNNNIYITYKDPEMGVTTIIKIKNGVVFVKRLGSLKGDLEFNKQQSHKTIYYTPYGEMEIEIITKECDLFFLEKGIKIYIEYKIIMQGKKISDNIYMIVAN